MLHELLPGIHVWHWFSERFKYDFNGTFVEHPGGNVVVDPVETDDATRAELSRRGVARIVLTNRNHFRDAARLREATGARVAAHPADAGFVRARGVTVDDELAAGDRVGPFTVVAMDGKSPGEIALHWPERRLLLIGDACVGNPPGQLGLLPPAAIDDRAALIRSLGRAARELDVEVVLVGDGVPILSGGGAALATLVHSLENP
jgi:glyoxylase-like metal-dependent hydrolase (beta-lactamase superfamily II)